MQETQEMWVPSLGQEEDPLEEEMATHSSILAWKIPWTEEPGGLHSLSGSKSQSVSPLNHASQVFVLLLKCYAFGKKKKVFLIKPKHFFVLFLWRYKLWKIFCLFLCLYKHDSLDFSFPDLIVNSKTSTCLYCLYMDLKNLKWIWISVFNSVEEPYNLAF